MSQRFSILLFVSFFSYAQGLPFVTQFSNNIKTRLTTFDAAEDTNGIIYFVNESGLLRFNGNSWTSLALANFEGANSIYISKENILYLGGLNEFGYIDLNRKKSFQYVSLRKNLPDSITNFNKTWYIKENKAGIYFQTRKYIFRYRAQTKKLSHIHSKKGFHTLHEVNGKIYTRALEKGGLCEVIADELKLSPHGEFFEYGNSPFLMFADSKNELIYGTRRHGLFKLIDGKKKSFGTKELNEKLRHSVLYRGIKRENDQGYIIATLTNGVFILDRNAKLELHINNEKGLSDSDVKNVFLDRRGNLWLSLNSGINRVELNSPYSIIDKRNNFRLEANYLHQIGKSLYVATNNGIWLWQDQILKELESSREIIYEFIEIDGELFANSEFYIYKIDGEKVTPFSKIKSYDIVNTINPKIILLANDDGLALYELKEKSFELLYQIKESVGRIHNVLEVDKRSFWYQDRSGELSNIVFDEKMESYSISTHPYRSLAKKSAPKLLTLHGNLYTVINDSTRIFNKSEKKFKLISNPAIDFKRFQWISRVNETLSIATTTGNKALENIYSNELSSTSTHARLQSLIPVNQVFSNSEKYIWLTFYGAIVLYDQTWNDLDRFKFRSNISKVEFGKDSLFSRSLIYTDTIKSAIPYKDNQLRFTYNSNAYIDEENSLFRYKLLGYEKDWSEWSRSNFKEYTNLDDGDYNFIVESKSVYGQIGTPASVRFKILPPWHRSTISIFLYALLFIFLFYFSAKFWTRRLINRNQELESIVQKRTEQLKLQTEKLKSVNTLKTQFFTNISHEIRTPLTLLLSPFDKLENESMSAKAHKTLAMMKNNGQRLLALVNQLLDFSKLEHGRLPVLMEAVDIVEIIQHIVSSFQSERKVRFAHKVNDFKIKFDREKLNKIMYNLISNALKFSDAAMPVDVELKVNIDTFTIVVVDRGIGIADDDQEKIFDRFYQVDQSQERSYEGSGIGLALTKELVELIGGTISVKSTKNFGSRFSIRFPFEALELNSRPSADLPHNEEVQSEGIAAGSNDFSDKKQKNYSILIAEDNKDLRSFVAEIFADDFNVIAVEDGQAALGALKKKMPDLIISDVMMPRLDGFELLKQIKENKETSHIPTILLTAKAADHSKLEGLTHGANDYLTKPFSAEELKLRVRNQLSLIEAVHRQYDTVIQNDTELAKSNFEHPFVSHAVETVIKFIDDADFDVEKFCYEIGVSRSNLHRKLKALTGQSTTDFIRQIRLKKAKELLLGYNETVSSVAVQVGFNSLSYFNRQFKRLYNINPSDYRKRHHHL